MSLPSALFKLHVAALLFGSTALFGHAMRASPVMIVLGRTGFAVLALGLFAFYSRRAPWQGLAPRDIGRLMAAGVVLALHWVTFFLAVRSGGVALATLGFASFPVFVALLELAVLGERMRRKDGAVLILVLAGLVLITPAFDLRDTSTAGLLWGILSGAIYAAIAVFNRYLSNAASGTQSCWWQCLAAACVLAPFGWREAPALPAGEWLLLACLGAVCTGLAYTMLIHALEQVKAQTAAIVICMEPVYAIALAWLVFGTAPGASVLLGGSLVIGAVMLSTLQPGEAA
jgi:drug/metabolite transporter (DMT)-like permease